MNFIQCMPEQLRVKTIQINPENQEVKVDFDMVMNNLRPERLLRNMIKQQGNLTEEIEKVLFLISSKLDKMDDFISKQLGIPLKKIVSIDGVVVRVPPKNFHLWKHIYDDILAQDFFKKQYDSDGKTPFSRIYPKDFSQMDAASKHAINQQFGMMYRLVLERIEEYVEQNRYLNRPNLMKLYALVSQDAAQLWSDLESLIEQALEMANISYYKGKDDR